MTLDKPELLAFALTADYESMTSVLNKAFETIAKNDGLQSGFRRFRDSVEIGRVPSVKEVTDWIDAVRLPETTEERTNKAIRNRLVYDFENLGEFAHTLRDRLQGRFG